MIAVHVTSVYTLPGIDRDTLVEQCDVLQDALMDLEAGDDSVTDSTVSVDLGQRRVEVEVLAIGSSPADAVAKAHSRIQAAVSVMRFETGFAESRSEPVQMTAA